MPYPSLRPSLLGLLLLTGCGQAEPLSSGERGERVGAEEAPIINGMLDTTHQAVVAVLGNDFECSGTIIQVKNGLGYVLTAAHCCPPGDLPHQVVMGNDYYTGQTFNIVNGSQIADPCYQSCAGSTDDVCMLKFSGASASTPVIPAMTSQTDTLAVGTAITYVGYGLTAAPPNGDNSKRRSVAKTIGSVDSYFVDYANAAASGTCEGDSGGPGLVVVGGVELVASVTSYGDQTCSQLGAAIRTSSVYASFISSYLADTTATPSCPSSYDCNACMQTAESPTCNGGCSQVTTDCFNDAACSGLVQCYQACATQACLNTCNTQNLDGLQKYEAIESCLCSGTCGPACNNQLCLSPKCGTKPSGSPATCGTCVEDSCCAEAWTCSTDSACKKCFSAATPDPSCATNAAALAYYQCTETSCAGKGCVLKDPTGGAGTTSSAGVTSSASSSAAGGTTSASSTGSGPSGNGGDGGQSGASGTGGGSANESSGCAVSGPVRDRVPAAPLAALLVGAAAAVQRRRRRA